MNGLAICAGIGGLELGLRITLGEQYRTVCHVEREASSAATLVARMEDETLDKAPVWDDITSFDGSPWRGHVDILAAGFPCQPHSVAGCKKGTEDERWIWPSIARTIRDVGPRVVFLENVPNLLNSGAQHVFGTLAKEGCDTVWDCFSAAEVGGSHRRQRLFILAYRPGCGLAGLGLPKGQGAEGKGTADTERYREKLADSDFLRCGDERTDSEVGSEAREDSSRSRHQPSTEPSSGSESLADTDRVGSDAGRVDAGRQKRTDSSGCRAIEELADAEKQRLLWIGPARENGRGIEALRRGGILADADGTRHEERQGQHGDITEECPSTERGSGGLGPFPPGPDASEEWEQILSIAPELAPALESAVCRVAYGPSVRVDRLRACGNSVVPLVVAYAYVSLARLALKEST